MNIKLRYIFILVSNDPKLNLDPIDPNNPNDSDGPDDPDDPDPANLDPVKLDPVKLDPVKLETGILEIEYKLGVALPNATKSGLFDTT